MPEVTDAPAPPRFRKDWDPTQHYRDAAIATDYDSSRFTSPVGRLFDRLEKRKVRAGFAEVVAGETIADIPCGTGRLAEMLLENGYAIHGFDISRQMLDQAERRLARFAGRFSTEVTDARELRGGRDRFAGVLCARVLMHFPYEDQVAFLRGAASLTAGPIVFTQGVDTRWHRFRRRVKRVLRNQNPASFPLTPPQVRSLIADAGLTLVRRSAVLPVLSESFVFVTRHRDAARPGG